jgi:tetratricopeptide (TPR) repeat protein/serine/threonine protein kinase
MAEQPQGAEAIFFAALELADLTERAAYVEGACAGDAALLARVRELLAAHDETSGPLDAVPPGRARPDTPLPDESAGTVLGPYKMLQQIGEGGMGTVWMAQQTEPVKRLVALKVIKPGMDSRQVIARFEAERQALALMDHPNIARVLDAATTGAGRPYFVMELVKGVPITAYCDEHRVTPKERLELFIPVCQAIQHAHQKGVIHRDIKPSNVLVASYDGKPVPKVIDFGIAKATGQQLTEKTLVTGFGNVVGTLEYMSPEQAELNALDIDTRSDVYALGVLLYELLTGSTPLEKKRLKETAMLEVLRLIREEEPPRPSTRLSTTDELPAVAAKRGLEPKKLSGLVRGELDWIVMKALEKDRNRRYETANGLAQDVQRYLAAEPVAACPPSAWYRFRKFARRNKRRLVFAAGTCLLAAVTLGSIGWALRDRAARQAQAGKDQELAVERAELYQGAGRRAEALAAVTRAELLAGEAPADPDREARLAAVKERLAAEARDQQFVSRFEGILLRVKGQVDIQESKWTQTAAFLEIQDALRQYGIALRVMPPAEVVARIQGRPERVGRHLIAALGECLRCMPTDAVTRQWLLAVLNAADRDPWRVRVREAEARSDWMALERLAGEADIERQPPSFLSSLAATLPATMKPARLELLRRVQRAYPADLWANYDLAWELDQNGHPGEAVRYYTAALALRPDNPGIYLNRGLALKKVGELDGAIADSRQALALAPHYPAAHGNLGLDMYDKGRLDEAIAEYREALRLKPNLAKIHTALGNALVRKGRLDEAIAEHREAIRIDKDYPLAHNNLGVVLQSQGQWGEAIAEFREALRLKEDDPAPHTNLGGALQAQGHLDEAIVHYRRALALTPHSSEAHASDTHGNLGVALIHKGRLDEAIAEFREAIRLKTVSPGTHSNLGSALEAKGRLDEAIAEHREAIRLAIRCKKDIPLAHLGLGNALKAKGRLDEAIAEYREAIAVNPQYANAHYNLGNALAIKQQWDEAITEFRTAIAINPQFAEAHYHLGDALFIKQQWDEAITAYRTAIRINKDYPPGHGNLGIALFHKGRLDEAIAAYREALRLKPDSPETQLNLGNALKAKGRLDEAIAAYREAIRIKKDYAEAHTNLGTALDAMGRLDEAMAEYHEALRLKPNLAPTHLNLGNALRARGRLEEAIAAYREAIHLKKDCPEAHFNLGLALDSQGQRDEAIAEFREALRLKEDFAEAHCNLGGALMQKGLLDEAIEEHRKAIRINKNYPPGHSNLGRALYAKGRLDEAIAAYREALRLKPDSPETQTNLGAALHIKGRLDEAIAAYREALRLQEDYAAAHYTLSSALRQQGRFQEALKEMRRAHELGSRNPRWPYPSANGVRESERLVELDARLAKIREGKAAPASPAERIELAQLCSLKRLHRTAARFYAEAFAAEPSLADDLRGPHRYNAACAAVLAGSGQGEDADKLDENERARLRGQALSWLRADLAAWARLLDEKSDKAGPPVAKTTRHWLADPDFTGVRSPALAQLPEAERQAWQKLWADAAELLSRAERTTPEKK